MHHSFNIFEKMYDIRIVSLFAATARVKLCIYVFVGSGIMLRQFELCIITIA